MIMFKYVFPHPFKDQEAYIYAYGESEAIKQYMEEFGEMYPNRTISEPQLIRRDRA